MADPWRKLNNTAPFGVDTMLLLTDGSIFPLSCCHPYCRRRSNDVSVKALLAARGDFLLLAGWEAGFLRPWPSSAARKMSWWTKRKPLA
jgi:hypothetical protein